MISKINYSAYKKIKLFKKQNFQIVICSASLDCLVQIIAEELDVIAIGTKTCFIKSHEGFNQLKIEGKNCNRIEKLNRIYSYFKEKIVIHSAYGDSKGDYELLKESKFPFYKEF